MKQLFLIFFLLYVGSNFPFKSGNTNNLYSNDLDITLTINDQKSKSEIPRIDFVSLSKVQPEENDTHVIWFDDFDEEKKYKESTGKRDEKVHYGETGASMDAGFNKGDVSGRGNRKLFFGDNPGNSLKIRENEKFDEIYWRIYVKHEYGWEGAPKKMSRATSIVASNNWKQAMISHVWSGKENTLTLDPARGVKDQSDQIKTTKYNDFGNLDWLGNSPSSKFQISSTEESGYWILVEARAKLNTPGKSDGENQLWIDGRLEAERKNLNFRGSYTKHGINAVFLESYWNTGSVKTQGRWYDNFIVSTKPIGPITSQANPTLYKTPFHGSAELEAWEIELASDYEGNDIVYKSKRLSNFEQVEVNKSNGRFLGSLQGKSTLSSGKIYYCRVRQKGSNSEWSDWSRWHQGFSVE